MNEAVLVLCLLNFASIGALPRVFFQRDGSFNPMWWLTASPFVLSAGALVATFVGVLPPLRILPSQVTDVAAVPFAAASIGLIALTMGTHRIPIALWHQQDDAPRNIVTYGAYSRIRHPFYAAFLLALSGAFIFSPQVGTLVGLVFGAVILNATAAREERRLCASAFGEEYAAYMRRTGRFLPRLGRTAP